MRYRLRTLLIAMAFASICFGGIIWRWKLDSGSLNWFYRTVGIIDAAPYWVPVVFCAYAVGRRQMTLPFICSFAAAEAAAVGAVIWLIRVLTP
jgi:hypothetical protein